MGQGNHTVPLPPFAPAAGRRLSRAAEGGNSPRRGYGHKTKERLPPLLCRFFAFYAVFSQIDFLLL